MVRIDVSAETFQRERFPCEYSLSAGRSLTLNDCSRLERTLRCGSVGASPECFEKVFNHEGFGRPHTVQRVLYCSEVP